MASINGYIDPRSIIAGLKATDKHQAVAELVARIVEVYPVFAEKIGADALGAEVMKRESIQTTGLGHGVAFPHARVGEVEDFAIAIGITREPIDWASLDGEPVRVVCLMISPQHKPYIILQVAALLARFFSDPANIADVTSGLSPEQIAKVIKAASLEHAKVVLASDIMRPAQKYVYPDTAAEEAAHMMHLNQIDILPVVDHQMNLLGEISCLDIFTYSLPDFFNQLQTISFMRNLDPFEKYFRFKKDVKVRDIFRTETNKLSRESTLMEIVSLMTARKREKLFVVDGDQLIGAIDRFTIIDKILFF